MLQGSLVAIVTPMFEDGRLDIDTLTALIEYHVEQGSDGIVIVGTTGESPTVDFDEHCLLIKTAVKVANGRIPVIAGTGANSTSEAITLTQKAKDLGVDACLLVAPYYNKPTQEGLYQHFMAVANAVDIPQILYNVPGRTGCDITNETTLRLASHVNLVGIKDATGGIERGTDLILRAPENFAVYSGDDATSAALILLGARGSITVTGNVAPKLMHEMCAAAIAGNVALVRELNAKLFQLHQKLFIEANPIPVKWLLAEMGLIKSGIRLPMVSLSSQHHDVLRNAARAASIL